MKRERRTFTAEFKDEAVRLALSGEKKMSSTARDLGLGVTTLQRWVAEYRAKTGVESSPTEVSYFQLSEENKRLREENRRLQMERDILKKCMVSLSESRCKEYQKARWKRTTVMYPASC